MIVLSSLIVVVFSFYQELKAKTIKDVGHNNEGLTEETTWSRSDLTIFFSSLFFFGQSLAKNLVKWQRRNNELTKETTWSSLTTLLSTTLVCLITVLTQKHYGRTLQSFSFIISYWFCLGTIKIQNQNPTKWLDLL